MKSRTAIVFGGTGLVGKGVIDELIKTDSYELVKVFVRSSINCEDRSKIREFIIDFDHPQSFSEQITGDDIFICLGTTIKKAGSVLKMEEIDRDLPVNLAKIARKNNVLRLAVISTIGSNQDSSSNYLRIKGEMEQRILELDFDTIAVVRPSLLLGERNEKRFGESAGKVIINIFGIFLFGKFRKYRAIEAKDVAQAMVRILKESVGKEIFESDRLQKISDMK